MTFVWKDKLISGRRFLSYVAGGLGAIMATVIRWPARVWLAGAAALAIGMAGFLVVPQLPTVTAAPEPNPPLDCISCHPKTLQFHDKLGSENKACLVCHDGFDMKKLHLTDGTPLSLSDSPKLCSQCHQKRYTAWQEGTHGIPDWKEGVLAGTGADKATCTTCHDAHQPQIALLDITEPHPPAAPSPPQPPGELLIILGIALLVAIVIGVAVVKRGEWPWTA